MLIEGPQAAVLTPKPSKAVTNIEVIARCQDSNKERNKGGSSTGLAGFTFLEVLLDSAFVHVAPDLVDLKPAAIYDNAKCQDTNSCR